MASLRIVKKGNQYQLQSRVLFWWVPAYMERMTYPDGVFLSVKDKDDFIKHNKVLKTKGDVVCEF